MMLVWTQGFILNCLCSAGTPNFANGDAVYCNSLFPCSSAWVISAILHYLIKLKKLYWLFVILFCQGGQNLLRAAASTSMFLRNSSHNSEHICLHFKCRFPVKPKCAYIKSWINSITVQASVCEEVGEPSTERLFLEIFPFSIIIFSIKLIATQILGSFLFIVIFSDIYATIKLHVLV